MLWVALDAEYVVDQSVLRGQGEDFPVAFLFGTFPLS